MPAGRGLSVLLVERGDLAGATSSASSKLIHGGLRYLEFGEFRLVREALVEREVLMRMAPHLIHPADFVLPHDRSLRPRWMLRLGLLLYDHLGGRKVLPASRRIDPRSEALGAPLRRDITAAFVFSDCQTDDARLVIANARDAARRGARILRGTEFVSARRVGSLWRAELRASDGARAQVEARALVNAGGPWAMEIARRAGVAHGEAALRLVKGSHIVVPPTLRWRAGPTCSRTTIAASVFVLPFEQDFTLIGTTEAPFEGDPAEVACSDEEAAYLCRAVGRWFARPVQPGAILWRYAGVRPLYEDHAKSASAVTRDYVLLRDAEGPAAPMLSVLGGKITTFRRLAEHALERLGLPGTGRPWTAGAPLPGGVLAGGGLETAAAALRAQYSWLDPVVADRLIRRYGNEAAAMLGEAGQRRGIWARPSAPVSPPARSIGSGARNGRKAPTTSSGAAPSSGYAAPVAPRRARLEDLSAPRRSMIASAVGRSLLLSVLLYLLRECASTAMVMAQSAQWSESAVEIDGGSAPLRGTIAMPPGPSPIAAVLIIAGSGPTDRDGNQPGLRNESLKLLAHGLAGLGIGSLRVDKRGIGESAAAMTSEQDLRFATYVRDAVAWVTFLRGQARVRKVFMLGHSEGALVVTLAAQQARVGGLILIAGLGVPAGVVLRRQLDVSGLTGPLRQSAEVHHCKP